MKKTSLVLLTFAFCCSVAAQVKKTGCNCPVQGANGSGKADKIFTFSNQATIGLCGSYDKESGTYAEFVLYRCGQTKTISEWNAMHPCHVKMDGDTLVIKQEYGLPIAKNFGLTFTPFYIEKYYFKGNVLADTAYCRKDVPKYSAAEVSTVLKQYMGITQVMTGDDKVAIAGRLFWAFVSGSKRAELYLKTFQQKFGPFDGANGEDFDEIWGIYQLYIKR